MDQIVIVLTTVPAIFMSQSRRPALEKWACILGLIGEPFWFYSSIKTGSWGVFVTAIVITGCWLMGVKNYWFRRGIA